MAIYSKCRPGAAQTIANAILSTLCIQQSAGDAQPQDDAVQICAWVMSQGISDGSSPDRAATRSEVWRMLYRMRDQG